MTARIRCANCEAESFLGQDTELYCVTCWNRLVQKKERFDQELGDEASPNEWVYDEDEEGAFGYCVKPGCTCIGFVRYGK